MEAWAAIISAVLTLVGLFAGWLNWRRAELRREDVLLWANKSIEALQTIQLICAVHERLEQKWIVDKFVELTFTTSILVEQGRLFFKNKPFGSYGVEKPSAYRGLRPRILDYLVIAHQIACEWNDANELEKTCMKVIAEDCQRNFVSMIQKEVGRGRTASADTSQAGNGVHLQTLIRLVVSA